jgi:hypothetical protein
MSMIRKTVAMLMFLGMAGLAAPVALAADGDGMVTFRKEVQSMAHPDGMVRKSEFLAMMEKKWNAMDKGNKGMLSVEDVMRIFADNKGQ